MIPKIIHQTWKTNDIPDEWTLAVDSCKTINNYKYVLWTDKTMLIFMKKEYPNYVDLYNNYTYNIQRCDAFRYFVLYKYGGIYLDMDIICKKKFDMLLKYDLVLAKSSNVSISYTNAFFMAKPKNEFIKYCIDNLIPNKNNMFFLGKHISIMCSTGPLYLTNMINNYKLKNIHNYYILTKNEFSGDCNVCNENICKGGTYLSHVKGNSWHSIDSTIYNNIFCNYKIILLCTSIIIIFLITYKYKYKSFKKLILRK